MAAVDWWARGVAAGGVALTAVNVAWSIRSWRRANTEVVEVYADPSERMLTLRIFNRGVRAVTVRTVMVHHPPPRIDRKVNRRLRRHERVLARDLDVEVSPSRAELVRVRLDSPPPEEPMVYVVVTDHGRHQSAPRRRQRYDQWAPQI